jgi:hypothetical protein
MPAPATAGLYWISARALAGVSARCVESQAVMASAPRENQFHSPVGQTSDAALPCDVFSKFDARPRGRDRRSACAEIAAVRRRF